MVTEYTHLDHPVSKNENVEKFSNSEKFQNTPKTFYAGKFSSNIERWKEITSDRKVLKIDLGYQLEFVQPPLQVKLPHQI